MPRIPKTARRRFLKAALAGLAAPAFGPAAGWTLSVASPKQPLAPEELKRRIRGPILSVPTPFTADFQIDHPGVRTMIDRAAKAGVQVFALTSGNSQYDQLTYEEIKQLTRTVAEALEGRGVAIAATGPWWTGQAVDYARFAEAAGADAVQVLLPRYGDEDSLFQHFKTVAESTRLGLVLHGAPTFALLKRLVKLPSLVAVKAEFSVDYTVAVYQQWGERLNLFQGGQKSHFVAYYPYGMRAYYSTFSTFAPEIAMRFWKAVEAGKMGEARDFVLKYDVPFFERWSHAFWRATLEYFGVASRYLRPPDKSFTDAQMKEVGQFFEQLRLRLSA